MNLEEDNVHENSFTNLTIVHPKHAYNKKMFGNSFATEDSNINKVSWNSLFWV